MGKHSKNNSNVLWLWIGFIVSALLIVGVIVGIYFKKNNTKEVSSTDTTVQNTVNEVSLGDLLNAIEEVNKEQNKEENINAKELIRIKSITTSKPNSANGVDLKIQWTNMSEKEIKYITFTAYPVNAVGDIVECTIRTKNKGQFKGQETGPIKKGEGSKTGYVYENAWYNNTIVKAILMQVDIQYMDGSMVSLSGQKLDEVIY